MRKLTRMAAIGGVGLLALTACGDDETEENTESTEEEAGYDSADDLGVEEAQAFLSGYVAHLENWPEISPTNPLHETGVPGGVADEDGDGVVDTALSANCDEGDSDFTCEVFGEAGSSVIQTVTIEFQDTQDADTTEAIDASITPVQVNAVYSEGDDESVGRAWELGVFNPDIEDEEESYLYHGVPLSAFDDPSSGPLEANQESD